MNFLTLLQNANNEYDRGNLLGAKKYNDDVLQQFEAMNITVDSVFAIPYFNSLTLAQSIACRLHDLTSYESYEEAFKKITLALTGTYAWSYYGVHLLDACECYLNSGDCAKAQQFLNNGISILIEQNGSCNLIIFLQYYHTAKLHFHMNQYYLCIDCCQKANDAWMSDSLIPEDATSFLNQYISNENLILTMVYSNLILAGCAYGKINSPEIGIQILEEIINDPLDNYYIQTSAEITLAELYTRAENLTKARTIYQKYKNMNQLQYPDLAAALAALAIVLDTPDSLNTAFSASLYLAHLKPAVGSSITPNTPTLFASEFDGQLPPSSCYSKDALQILLYNHCLALIAKEQYSKAELNNNVNDVES